MYIHPDTQILILTLTSNRKSPNKNFRFKLQITGGWESPWRNVQDIHKCPRGAELCDSALPLFLPTGQRGGKD